MPGDASGDNSPWMPRLRGRGPVGALHRVTKRVALYVQMFVAVLHVLSALVRVETIWMIRSI
jgi:hypothetical protein